MPFPFEKPLGTQDFLPDRIMVVEKIVNKAKKLLTYWGYEEVQTPVIEYYQTVGHFSKFEEEKLLKFFDGTGKTVVLRPDFTTPIARFVSSVYREVEFPIRIMYQGNVFRNNRNQGIEEINQLGIELIGLKGLEADAEVINLAIKIIKKFNDWPFKVSLGHTGFLKELFKQVGCKQEIQDKLFKLLLDHDYVNYRYLVNNLDINKKYQAYLLEVLKLRGDYSSILEIKKWFDNTKWLQIFAELAEIWQLLEYFEVRNYVYFDLSLVGTQNYYTGLIYNVYCQGHPLAICSGGRYDGLVGNFGRPAPAAGFAINLDYLLNVISIKKLQVNKSEKILLIFPENLRSKALKKAEELRKKGKIVVLASQDTVSRDFIKSFSEVINLTVMKDDENVNFSSS